MPGPTPKEPRTRQRSNKAATASILPAEAPLTVVPELYKSKVWHEMTVAWWKDAWASPMATKWLRSDTHGLHMLAELIDRFWQGEVALAAEIRLQGQRYGLSPIDRWRLQWGLADAEPATQDRRPEVVPQVRPEDDPRGVLRAVK